MFLSSGILLWQDLGRIELSAQLIKEMLNPTIIVSYSYGKNGELKFMQELYSRVV